MSKYKHPQRATLWRKDANGFSPDGSVSWELVGTVDTRWEDEQRLGQNNTDRFIFSRSVVYFAEDVFEIGDMIAEGEYYNETPEGRYFEIKDKIRIPNLSGNRYELKAVV